MSRKRLATWAGGAALLAAWLSSAADTMPGGAPSAPPVGEAAQSATAPPNAPSALARIDLEREVARMAAYLEEAPRLRPIVRNPFTLSPRGLADRAGGRAAIVPEGWASRPAATAPAAPLRVSLAGIATDDTSSGPRRTAVLSVAGQVMLVEVGDEVPGPYQVQRIDADAVELFDPGRQTSFRLSLP